MELHEWHWPVRPARGAVALIHGAGEHCGRYAHVAEHLNRKGYAVLGLDLPGLGRSPGRRGHIDRFDDYLPVVDETLARLRREYPGSPIALYGHSMGGLIAVRWLQSRHPPGDLRAIVLTSPCLDLSLPVSPGLLRTASVLDHLLPTLRLTPAIPASAVSRHPEVVAAYAKDPLVVPKATVRWGMELQRGMAAARAGSAEFPAPTLILQAGEDRLVAPQATRAFAKRLRAPAKEYREFPGRFHELHNEPEREEILELLAAFLEKSFDQ